MQCPRRCRPSRSRHRSRRKSWWRRRSPGWILWPCASFGLTAGLILFLATLALLLQGGILVGKNLSLLSHYLWGYSVSWDGALRGFLQVGVGGFGLGFVVATLRNWGVSAYAWLLKRRAEAEASRDLLDKV